MTPFGALAGVPLPAAESELHADERAFAATLASRRRVEWVGGRVAFRRAAAQLGGAHEALLAGPRGEPMLPENLAGSISHKSALAVALVTRADAGGASLGIDLEELAPPRFAIEEIALRPEEREALRAFPDPEKWERLVIAFAVKEALYKALHPRLHRYVRYDEAAVVLPLAGEPEIRLHLEGGARFSTVAHMDREPGFVLACVRVTPA